MIANEEMLTSGLAGLAGDELDDAELERRVTRFQGALRRLRDDPAEAARIDALAMDAERAQRDFTVSDVAATIFVNGEVVNVVTRPDEKIAVLRERVAAELARLAQERQKLTALLEDSPAAARPRRRIWGLWPAFGGSLVAVLAVVALVAALHASAAAASLIGVIMAVSTAATALISVGVAWTSVRELNRHGGAYKALQLMVRGDVPEFRQVTAAELGTRIAPLRGPDQQQGYEDYEDYDDYGWEDEDDYGYARPRAAPPGRDR
jgi:hypothetical protein